MSQTATATGWHLLAAETRKLRTVPTTWVLTGIGWALVALSGLLPFVFPAFGTEFTGSSAQVAEVIDAIGGNSMIVLIVGLLAVTTEFRHGTIGRTLQLVPSRLTVLGAKLAAGAVYAVLFVVTSLALVAALLLALAVAHGEALQWGPEVTTALWQAFVGLVLTALFGVALGALLRSQVIAITVALLWVFVVEQFVAFTLPRVGQWLPFQALNSVFITEEARAQMPPNMAFLEPGTALAAFVGYVVLFTLAAAILMRARDV
ncbi:hypothetical protein [Egicoccus halophilus]|uniref:ABC transporter permease n=1 Tax=Egicoccus halophilus TaxID=1670830 RepID=A0A8J3A857_9ACTN|nr:hypothetical protein [Egicoccus halophilus]GGI06142.1 ABC transporter permease [Egicoccus halophilus]